MTEATPIVRYETESATLHVGADAPGERAVTAAVALENVPAYLEQVAAAAGLKVTVEEA